MPRTRHAADSRLLRRSQQGDRKAFRALVGSYDWRLRGLAHALLLDPERVDAVLQVAYLKAWREVVRVDPRDDAAAWLYRITYNGCIDALRHESNRSAAPRAAGTVSGSAAATPVASGGPAPAPGGDGSSPTPAGVGRPRVVEALATLPPADRVAVVLVDREGFPPAAAARILGVDVGAFEARLAGARARLTIELAPAAADTADAAPPDGAGPPDGRSPSPDTDAAPSGDAVPAGEAAPSGDAVPAGEAAPSGEAVPAADAASTGDAAPSGEAVPAADAASTDDAAPSGEAVPAADAAPAGEAAPSGDAVPAADAAHADGVTASTTEEAETDDGAPTSKEPVDATVTTRTGVSRSPNGAAGKRNKANGSDGAGDVES